MWARAMWALLALEVVATLADLAFGPWGPRVHWEERFNARAGVQIACGHIDAVWAMQYRTFCGGCTAEAVMAAPLFLALGPVVKVWKVIPTLFHLGIVALGMVLARRAVDERAAVAWLVLMIGAPAFYRDLALTGWGNHAESTFFPFAAAAVVIWGRGRLHVQAIAGAIAGLGLWFCHTSAHALPAVAVVCLWTGRWRAVAAGAAVPLGLLPWWRYHQVDTAAKDWTRDWAGMLDAAPLDELWRWLAGDFLRAGLWPHDVPEVAGRISTEYPDTGVLPSVWWGALWLLAIAGMGLALAALRNRQSRSPSALLFGPLAFIGLLGAYWLRHDLWVEAPEDVTFASFNLRYRTPLVPMLMLCVTPLAAWRSGRWVVWPLVGGLALFGTGMRALQWDEFRQGHDGLQVYLADTRPDRTVPTGQPPQRRVQSQGRPQDVRAALEYLASHEDPLPECRADHLLETGRRIGLGAHHPEVLELAAQLELEPEQRRLVAEGIARHLVDEDGTPHNLESTLAALAGPLGDDVAHEVGRRANSIEHADPRMARGACERRAEEAVSLATSGGERSPGPLPSDACDGWDDGIGRGWARYVSCDDAPPRGQAAWSEACPRYRR